MLSVYFNEMPSVFILPAYIKLLKQQKALKNQPFFKAFSRSFFTANSMGLVDKNTTFIHCLVINNLFQYLIRKKVKHLLLSNHWGSDCNRCITQQKSIKSFLAICYANNKSNTVHPSY